MMMFEEAEDFFRKRSTFLAPFKRYIAICLLGWKRLRRPTRLRRRYWMPSPGNVNRSRISAAQCIHSGGKSQCRQSLILPPSILSLSFFAAAAVLHRKRSHVWYDFTVEETGLRVSSVRGALPDRTAWFRALSEWRGSLQIPSRRSLTSQYRSRSDASLRSLSAASQSIKTPHPGYLSGFVCPVSRQVVTYGP